MFDGDEVGVFECVCMCVGSVYLYKNAGAYLKCAKMHLHFFQNRKDFNSMT